MRGTKKRRKKKIGKPTKEKAARCKKNVVTVFADKTEILPYNGYKHKRTLTDGACERIKKQEGLLCLRQ